MPNFYLFDPLIGEDGKQVVRELDVYDWGEVVGPRRGLDNEGLNMADYKWPILKMRKFNFDHFKKIKDIHSLGLAMGVDKITDPH